MLKIHCWPVGSQRKAVSGVVNSTRRNHSSQSARLVHYQVTSTQQSFHRLWRVPHPVGGEPDSTRSVTERDAYGVASARGAIVGHIELQGIVAGNRDRRQRVGDVLDVAVSVELRFAGRGRSSASAA